MDITALGELLIDFTDAGVSQAGMQLFEQNAGGAPANVACCAAKLGHSSAFIGMVGDDMHGAFLRQTLKAQGVETRGLKTTTKAFTTLAFVALSETGERSFSFARKPGADMLLSQADLDADLLQSTRILSIGSLSLTAEPIRSATVAAAEMAKAAGAWIAYDPNDRPALWDSRAEAIMQMKSLLPYADILKVSDEEALLLTERKTLEDAAQTLCCEGIPLVAVTCGSAGALLCLRRELQWVAGFSVPTVDTTGAGDAFFGGLLCALLESGKTPETISMDQAVSCMRFANAVAACSIQKRGAIPAMPERAAAEQLLLG